jgi:hypothetical protein
MTCANLSVAIALAGGFAMLLAASGSPLNVQDQVQAVRAQLAGNKTRQTAKPTVLLPSSLTSPPPADMVTLAWSNGVPVQS